MAEPVLHFGHFVTDAPICGCADNSAKVTELASETTCAACLAILDDDDHPYHKEEDAAFEIAHADNEFRRAQLTPAQRAAEDEGRAMKRLVDRVNRFLRLRKLAKEGTLGLILHSEMRLIRSAADEWAAARGQDLNSDEYNHETDPLAPK